MFYRFLPLLLFCGISGAGFVFGVGVTLINLPSGALAEQNRRT